MQQAAVKPAVYRPLEQNELTRPRTGMTRLWMVATKAACMTITYSGDRLLSSQCSIDTTSILQAAGSAPDYRFVTGVLLIMSIVEAKVLVNASPADAKGRKLGCAAHAFIAGILV